MREKSIHEKKVKITKMLVILFSIAAMLIPNIAVNADDSAVGKPPVIKTETLKDGKANEEYNSQLDVEGTRPINVAIDTTSAGFSFPDGTLGVQDSSFQMFGTPTTSGKFKFKLTFSNQFGSTSKVFDLKIKSDKEKKDIKLDANGGVVNANIIQTNKNGKIDHFPVPTREGSVFAGWHFDLEGTKPVPADAVFEYDTTLYAKWMKLLKIKVNNGSSKDAEGWESEYVNIKANRAPEGKKFDRWIILSGDATIQDPTKEETYLIVGKKDVEIEAAFKNNVGSVENDQDKPMVEPDQKKPAPSTEIDRVNAQADKNGVTTSVNAKKKHEDKAHKSPKTGDEEKLYLYFSILGLAVILLTAAVARKSRHDTKL